MDVSGSKSTAIHNALTIAAALFVAPLVAQSEPTAQAPGAFTHTTDTLQMTRESAMERMYGDTISRYGDPSFNRWYEENVHQRMQITGLANRGDGATVGEGRHVLSLDTSLGGAYVLIPTKNASAWGIGVMVADADGSADNVTITGETIQPYLTYQSEGDAGRLKLAVSYIDSEQEIEPDIGDTRAVELRGLEINAAIGKVLGSNGWLVYPEGGIDARYVEYDDFELVSGGEVKGGSMERVEASLGVRVAHPLVVEGIGNSLLTPYFGVEQRAELMNPDYEFADVSNSIAEPDVEAVRWEAGLDWQFTPGVRASVEAQKSSQESVMLSISWRM